MTISSIIVEDAESNRENLKFLLKKHCPQVSILSEAPDIKSAIDLISKDKPELLFLDVRLPDGTAFDLLEQLNDPTMEIIFVTAYDEYALRAFQMNALDYLMKPIDYRLLINSVEKAIRLRGLDVENQRLENLLANIHAEDSKKRIALPMEVKTEFVSVGDIIHIESDNNYTTVYLITGESHVIAKTLKKFETTLKEFGFLRVHNSHLVNISQVKSLSKRDGGFIILSNGKRVPVSRNRKEMVFEALLG